MSAIDCPMGGIDPSIIRELSGIYKPFHQAFKELLTNAFDADADIVTIRIPPDSTEISIEDDGIGITPFEVRSELTKIGGSYKRNQGQTTKKTRPKIGSKGIGFLAVARYCSSMEIVSRTFRTSRGVIYHEHPSRMIDLRAHLTVPIPRSILFERLTLLDVRVVTDGKRKSLKRTEFSLQNGRLRLLGGTALDGNLLEIEYSIDWRGLEIEVVINYDYLLQLENKNDLSQLSDFCSLRITPLSKSDTRSRRHYTAIRLRGLKDFVVRDLSSPKKSGGVRNIESESGLDRFIWHLSRCTPIKYDSSVEAVCGETRFQFNRVKALERVVVHVVGREEIELRRPVWTNNSDENLNANERLFSHVAIDCDGLEARGYVLAHTSPIFPAEFRGIAVRVRNVQIGPPTFFGIERVLTGVSRSMLSQITGEINVFRGLDAIDSLNPGRDSFYEENLHYKLLKQEIVGNGEKLGGSLGGVISSMLEREQILSSVQSALTRATHYRKALVNLSLAINHYGSNGNAELRKLLAVSAISNALSGRADYDLAPGPKIGGFKVLPKKIHQNHIVDFHLKIIYLDLEHERWSKHIFLLGQHYDVVPKQGTDHDPLCEIDTVTKRVYVNWSHPLRQQMGDTAFLKSAIAWKLSYLSCNGNIDAMMQLALKLLTFVGT